jgi:hypothetical protein
MPRKNTCRRFDARFGVSEAMLEAEGVYVGQEFRDYETLSIKDLREKLRDLRTKIVPAEANLQLTLAHLPDHERLAVRCMLARDVFHIAALYERFLRGVETTGHTQTRPEELKGDEPAPVLLFADSLFG